jgi:hypothetical protein
MEDEFLRETSEIDVDFPETDIDVPPLEDHHFEILKDKPSELKSQVHLSNHADDDLDADDSVNESTQDEEDRSYQALEEDDQFNLEPSSSKTSLSKINRQRIESNAKPSAQTDYRETQFQGLVNIVENRARVEEQKLKEASQDPKDLSESEEEETSTLKQNKNSISTSFTSLE